MRRYGNASGDSGVVAYELGRDAITLLFRSREAYLYNARNPGREQVRHMQDLAERGFGLATYVNQFVRDNYARKLDAEEVEDLLCKVGG